MLRTVLILGTLILIMACGHTTPKMKAAKRKAHLYYVHGTNELLRKEYKDALKNLKEAARLDDKDSKIHNNLGMAYFFRGANDLAITHLKKAVKLDPKNADAMNNLASLYFRNGQNIDAEKLYLRILKDLTYKTQYRTYYNLALIAYKQRNYKRAMSYLDKSLKELPEYCPAHYQKGLYFTHKFRYDKALLSFNEAIKGQCYESPAAHYYIGKTLIDLQRYEEAQRKFLEIIEKFPTSPYNQLSSKKMSELSRSNKVLKKMNTKSATF